MNPPSGSFHAEKVGVGRNHGYDDDRAVWRWMGVTILPDGTRRLTRPYEYKVLAERRAEAVLMATPEWVRYSIECEYQLAITELVAAAKQVAKAEARLSKARNARLKASLESLLGKPKEAA
jgi:hypothetical protein